MCIRDRNWITLKLLYTVQDFGEHFLIADRVITRGLEALAAVSYTHLTLPTIYSV